MTVFKIGKNIHPATGLTPHVIGGKAYSLITMTESGLNVPPAIVIPCATTFDYQKSSASTLANLRKEVSAGMLWIEEQMGRPCLFSVRSGAPISMPGMMDTVLNVGLCHHSMDTFEELLGNKTVVDSHHRLFEMYGTTVLGFSKDQCGTSATVHPELTKMWQSTPLDQVMSCIGAVFGSWMSPRAIEYRKLNDIPDSLGTAVTIQAMVYGNLNDQSGSGVLFTRDPATGEDKIMAEYLSNAQGEDVVSGSRTPDKLILHKTDGAGDALSDWKDELGKVCLDLETQFKDMMDVEFTIESGKLWVLQCRRGKRTPRAAVKIATDLLKASTIKVEVLNDYLTVEDVCLSASSVILDKGQATLVGKGLASGGGVAAGKPVSSVEEALAQSKFGPVILCSHETTPNDIVGMAAAVAIITETGGTTSHAAVVSRAMNKSCVVGFEGFMQKSFGNWLVVDGDTGEVWSDPDKTMKIAAGGDHLVNELAQAIVEKTGGIVVSNTEGSPGVYRMADRLDDFMNGKDVILTQTSNVVIDMSSPWDFVSDEDASVWDVMRSAVDTAFNDAVGDVTKSVSKAPEVVVIPPRGSVIKGVKNVRNASKVEDLMAGDPVMVDQKFIENVIGSQKAYDALLSALGSPTMFGPVMTPHALIFNALA
jgi:pyruvate,orthophosphate dikinase